MCAKGSGMGVEENMELSPVAVFRHRRLSHSVLRPLLNTLARQSTVKDFDSSMRRRSIEKVNQV